MPTGMRDDLRTFKEASEASIKSRSGLKSKNGAFENTARCLAAIEARSLSCLLFVPLKRCGVGPTARMVCLENGVEYSRPGEQLTNV